VDSPTRPTVANKDSTFKAKAPTFKAKDSTFKAKDFRCVLKDSSRPRTKAKDNNTANSLPVPGQAHWTAI